MVLNLICPLLYKGDRKQLNASREKSLSSGSHLEKGPEVLRHVRFEELQAAASS
jgi:hypothetical protein